MLTSQTHDYTLYTLHAIYTLYNLSSWPDSRLLGRQACVLVLPGISDIINFSIINVVYFVIKINVREKRLNGVYY